MTGGDGASPLEKTQPAVISKGDHLLITAISSRNSSLSHYLAWQSALSEVWLCADRWKHSLFCFFACDVFSNFFFSFFWGRGVMECIILKRRGKAADSIWLQLAVLFVFVITELSFDLAGQCFCVGCKLAISLSHYHSNGHCKAPVRRSQHVSGRGGERYYVSLLKTIYCILMRSETRTLRYFSCILVFNLFHRSMDVMKLSFATTPRSPQTLEQRGKNVSGYMRCSENETERT